jgi:hypothetical protein
MYVVSTAIGSCVKRMIGPHRNIVWMDGLFRSEPDMLGTTVETIN